MSMASQADIGGNPQDTEIDERAGGDAEELVKMHGEDADIVAAHRADDLFCRGDKAGGMRWLKAFRLLALSDLLRLRKSSG